MHELLVRSFGGLSLKAYLRHAFFGAIVMTIVFLPSIEGHRELPLSVLLFSVVSTLLYPYSRYVYERVIGFIIGNNTLYANVVLVFFAKAFTISACWAFAIFVAPVGLLWLYFSRQESRPV